VHPYLKGSGWEPWRVLSSAYQSPANMIIACIWLFAFAAVIELMRAFSDKPFCLACYAPCLLMVAVSASISGVTAMSFSLGFVLAPLIAWAIYCRPASGARAGCWWPHAPRRRWVRRRRFRIRRLWRPLTSRGRLTSATAI
jgi:hypothetical protein